MLKGISKVTDGAIKGAVQSAGSNYIQTKATELIKTKFLDPKLISKIKNQLGTKFGTQIFYNDFDAYITEYKTIDRVFEMFYNIGKTTVLSSREFVTQNLDSFSKIYPQYGLFDLANIKECFEIIYDAIYESCVRLNPHTDLGKLQLSQAIYADQGHNEHEEMNGKIDLILSKVNSMMLNSNDLPIATADFESTSEAIKAFLREIDSVGSESCPVKNDIDAIEKYQKLLADVPIVLRGESPKQIDAVLCSIEAHLAFRHSNLGMVKEAFDCLDIVPSEVAETSKLYHFVRAMIIVGHHITDKYSDAECSIKRALELDNEYHRAFLAGQLLTALKKEVEKDVILFDLDSRFSAILTENNNKELIADFYAFRGSIYKEFDDYDAAEQDYKHAKEYGYDETIADLNIGILYYCQATSRLPRNERLFIFDIDVALIYRIIELFRTYLFGEKELSPYVRTRMVDTYVSCCGLIGAKHGLTPVSEYVCLPNLDYETIRTLLLGYDGIINDDLLTLLTPEDQFNVKIANCVKNGNYNSDKTLFCDLAPEEITVLHVSTIYLILQVCVANKDLETYKKFRCYILDNKENVMLDCLDAWALELEGDIENAKQKVESYSASSVDYKVLHNILTLYLRNDCQDDANKLLLRILNLYNEKNCILKTNLIFFSLRLVIL